MAGDAFQRRAAHNLVRAGEAAQHRSRVRADACARSRSRASREINYLSGYSRAIARHELRLDGAGCLLSAILTIACLPWAWPGWPTAARQARSRSASRGLFAHAAETIRRHHSPAVYGKTPVTPGPGSRARTSELNVFAPAGIDHRSSRPGVPGGRPTDVLARARAYLRRQIEATGSCTTTVPRDSQRGCELPPDADHTALLPRIALRPEERLMSAALREIERYPTETRTVPDVVF